MGIDCHTMLAVGPRGSSDPGEPRPLVCISNRGDQNGLPAAEDVTAPPSLLNSLARALAGELQHEDAEIGTCASAVLLNHPFKGGYITRMHGREGPVPWIQVEFSRALYLPDRFVSSARPGGPAPERPAR